MANMPKGETHRVRTVTVIGSNTAIHPGGVVAIVLNTAEEGPIAFQVTLESCAALRREIAAAESRLYQFQDQQKH
jgi:hypothetical protein